MSSIIKEKHGEQHGFWKVLDFHQIDSHGDACWWCRCESCGDIYSVRGFTLRNGKSTKCKCCAKRKRLNVR